MKLKHIFLAKTLMTLIGLWKFKRDELTKNQHVMYNIYRIFTQVYYVTFNASLIYAFKDINGEVERIDAFGIIMFCTVIFLKIFICQREHVTKIINYMEDFDQELGKLDKESLNIYYSLSEYNFVYSLILFGYSSMCGITIVICKYLGYKEQVYKASVGEIDSNDVTKPLLYNTWRPIDSKEHYFFAFCMDVTSAFMGCTFNIATQVAYLSLMTFIIGQLKILQTKFRKYGVACSKLTTEGKQLEYLRSILLEHKKIISFVNELDKNMKYMLFWEFTTNPLQITCVLYQLLVFKLDSMIYFRVTWLICMIIQMFTLTWHANEIQLNSIRIADSVYACKWYNLSNKIKQYLSIIIIRAQRPLTLSVGPFFILTNRTAVTSLKGAYSYLAILNNRRH